MLKRLEKRFARLAIRNLTIYLVTGQIFVFLIGVAQPDVWAQMPLIPNLVLEGEVWRIFTFVFLAPLLEPASTGYSFNIFFFFFEMYLLWMFGSALENHWGSFRYNAFLLIGYLATVGSAFIVPDHKATNAFIYGSVFLAFAFLYPDFTLYLFFILPVKIKWLALIGWFGFAFFFAAGPWMIRVQILASVANFLLFFAPDLIQMARRGQRRMAQQATAVAERDQPFHTCVVCDRTDQSDPGLEFRYCPQCTGAPCYCMDHIHDHPHR